MIPPELRHALWPGDAGSTWAVFDGARDARVHAMLQASGLEFRSLYAGTLAPVLERAAPLLVELPRGHRLAERWWADGRDAAWGVLLRTGDPGNLRHQLRKLLTVRDDGGRTLLFRWYDPRVLRAFLPIADAPQRAAFFGDVTHWWAEDGRGGFLGFTRDATGAVRTQRLQPAGAPA